MVTTRPSWLSSFDFICMIFIQFGKYHNLKALKIRSMLTQQGLEIISKFQYIEVYWHLEKGSFCFITRAHCPTTCMHSDHIFYFVGKPCILQYHIQWCLFSFCSKRAVHPLNLRYFVPYILTFCPSVGISHLSLRQIHSLCSQHFCLRRAVKTCKTKMWNCFQPVKHCHEEALQETLLNILLYLLN